MLYIVHLCKIKRLRGEAEVGSSCKCVHSFHNNCFFIYFLQWFFSSPELKAQVSFSYRLSSVVCPSVRSSVCLSVNFSYFQLLLKNHWANFNQTWHKASLGKRDSSLLKNERPRPFPRGDNKEIVKIH